METAAGHENGKKKQTGGHNIGKLAAAGGRRRSARLDAMLVCIMPLAATQFANSARRMCARASISL